LKKVQRQERIVEEVKLVLKPAYNDRRITKEHYKEILRKTVPKVTTPSQALHGYICTPFRMGMFFASKINLVVEKKEPFSELVFWIRNY